MKTLDHGLEINTPQSAANEKNQMKHNYYELGRNKHQKKSNYSTTNLIEQIQFSERISIFSDHVSFRKLSAIFLNI